MAHPLCIKLNKTEGLVPKPCTDKCEYWKYPCLKTACILSDVFSVRKGELCYEFKEKVN